MTFLDSFAYFVYFAVSSRPQLYCTSVTFRRFSILALFCVHRLINDSNDLGGIQKEAKAAKVKKPKTTRAKSDDEMT